MIKLKIKMYLCLIVLLLVSFSGTPSGNVEVDSLLMRSLHIEDEPGKTSFTKLHESLDTLHSKLKTLDEMLVKLEER